MTNDLWDDNRIRRYDCEHKECEWNLSFIVDDIISGEMMALVARHNYEEHDDEPIEIWRCELCPHFMEYDPTDREDVAEVMEFAKIHMIEHDQVEMEEMAIESYSVPPRQQVRPTQQLLLAAPIVEGVLDESVWDAIQELLGNDRPRAEKVWAGGPAIGYYFADSVVTREEPGC